MRVPLDECVPARLKRHIAGHLVRTVHDEGWAGVKNGELLRLAEQKFDAFVTVDRNLRFQQNLSGFAIAVVLLEARNNDIDQLMPLIPSLIKALDDLKVGDMVVVA
jgi:predicted nuclease of predicted toxin-antitoxin system